MKKKKKKRPRPKTASKDSPTQDLLNGYGLKWDQLLPEDQKLRKNIMLNAIQIGAPMHNLRITMDDSFGMSHSDTNSLHRELLREIRDEFTENQSFAKSEASLRLRRALAVMYAAPDPRFNAITSMENLLSRIEGTQAPIKIATLDVDENMRENLAQVLTTSTPARLRQFIARGREVAQLKEPDDS